MTPPSIFDKAQVTTRIGERVEILRSLLEELDHVDVLAWPNLLCRIIGSAEIVLAELDAEANR